MSEIQRIAGENMRFELWALADMIPATYNPRKALTPSDPEYQDIARSIDALDYSQTIILNHDGTIIAGHQRRTVMMDKGFTHAWCTVLEICDKAKEKALNIALNKIDGKWDNAVLKDLLLELDLNGYDFTITGFHQDELEDLIQALDIPADANDDDFDPDDARSRIETPITNRGDIWQLGRHRLMCGDATDAEDVAALMSGELLDLVITDPPYNVDYGSKVNGVPGYFKNKDRGDFDYIQADSMDSLSFYQFLLAAFRNINDAMRTGAGIYVFHAESSGLQFRQAYADAGLKMAQCLIWEKNTFVMGRQDYQWRHEPILYGWKEGAAHYFIKDRTQDTVILEEMPDFKSMKRQELLAFIEKFYRDNQDQSSVLYENKPSRNTLHPTMKPIQLIGRLMNNSSKPGWAVGDFFGGSGTTLMAAEQLGRTAYLMECDERNCDIIVQRWEAYTGKEAQRL